MAYTTIDDGSAYFQIRKYTGQGGTATAVTNNGNSDLQPDLIWFKSLTTTARWNVMDSTRGTTKVLYLEDTEAEATDGGSEKPLDSFNSDGFTAGESLDNHTNISGATMCAWQWKANGGTTSTLDAGSIDATVQTNTTSLFSIITYEGNGVDGGNVAHGLGGTWDIVIIKNRSEADKWMYFHKYQQDEGQNTGGHLDGNSAFANSVDGTARPTRNGAHLINLNAGSNITTINGDGENFVIYAWKEVKGFSKFGAYFGNAAADGPFVWTGFKPAFLLLKNINTTNSYVIQDDVRQIANPKDGAIYPNGTSADSDGIVNWTVDFLSNGFKVRNDDTEMNGSGNTICYMAFAKHPFVSSENVPVTAE